METHLRLAVNGPTVQIDRASSTVKPAALSSSTSSSNGMADLTSPVIQVNISSIVRPSQRETSDHEESFKTVPVTINTTACEVVNMLMSEAHDPTKMEEYCLLECIENEKGSYRRVIPDREKVLLIKQKWRKKGEGSFTLTCKADAECYGKRKLHVDSSSYFFTPSPRNLRSQRRYSLPVSFNDTVPLPSSELQHTEEKQDETSLGTSLGQKSMNMSKIMSQVVKDSSRSQQRRGSVSSGNVQRSTSLRTTPVKSHASQPSSPTLRDIVSIEPIICSPSYSAVRVFPEFVHSPMSSSSETGGDKSKTSVSPVRNALETLTEQEKADESSSTVQSVSKNDGISESLEKSIRKMEEGPILVHTVVLKEQYPVHPKKVFVNDPLPCSSGDILNGMPSSLVETDSAPCDPVSPSPASLNVVGIENSEMDLIESLTSILDSKLNAARNPNDDTNQATIVGDLISPKRRTSLVDEACSNIKRKRSIPHPSEQPRIPNRSITPSKSGSSLSSSTLLSPSHREELVTAATDFILDTRRKKSVVNEDHHSLKGNEEEQEATAHCDQDQPHKVLNFENFQLVTDDCQDHNNTKDTNKVLTTGGGGGGSLDDNVLIGGVGEEGSPSPVAKLRRHKSERFRPGLLSLFNKKIKTPVERRKEEVGGDKGSRHNASKSQKFSPRVPFKRSRSDHHFNKL